MRKAGTCFARGDRLRKQKWRCLIKQSSQLITCNIENSLGFNFCEQDTQISILWSIVFLYLAVFTEKAKFSHVSKVSAIKVLITSIVITAGDLSFVYGALLHFYRLSLWLIFLICLFVYTKP